MKRLTASFFLCLAFALSVSMTGCGGTPENTVAAPPETAPTAEELEAQYKSQQSDYAAQQKELQQRDAKR